jgi:hypothetical protein
MVTAPTPTSSTSSFARADTPHMFLNLGILIARSGILAIICRFTITPFCYLKIAVLTIAAFITGNSYVVRPPHQLPRFIASPRSRQIQAFSLTRYDQQCLYAKAGIQLRIFHTRTWKPEEEVTQAFLQHSSLPIRDFTTYQHTGPLLGQGTGIIGHGVRAVLIEELGRWPGRPRSLAARFYSYDTNSMFLGRLPIRFVGITGVDETIKLEDGYIRTVWQDLEAGMIHATYYPPPADIGFVTNSLVQVFGNANLSFVTDSGVAPTDE